MEANRSKVITAATSYARASSLPAGPSEAREASEGWCVYRLQSLSTSAFGYTGVSSNLHRRLKEHNRRENPSTAPYTPFCIVFTAAFPEKQRALKFEAYLKSGSGHAFARKRLW